MQSRVAGSREEQRQDHKQDAEFQDAEVRAQMGGRWEKIGKGAVASE